MSLRNPRAAESLSLPQNESFGTGFFLGIVSGAIGMFLFGTKQGRHLMARLREELKEEAVPLLETEVIQKLLPQGEESKENVEKSVGTWKNSFPKFQKKQF